MVQRAGLGSLLNALLCRLLSHPSPCLDGLECGTGWCADISSGLPKVVDAGLHTVNNVALLIIRDSP
ncbi:hypothetical protein FVEN_g13159 [Fusarium venenatum]|nr:hypothetical protein FVEN_g13159 [Fusarium venenatum]